MDGLSSASAAFAVLSIAIQLGESVVKLIEFYKAVEDAPDDINELFNELELLSAILEQSTEILTRSAFREIAARVIAKCHKRIRDLQVRTLPVMAKLMSGSSLTRKWSSLKITLKKEEINKARSSIKEAMLILHMVKQNAILDITSMALKAQEQTSKEISSVQDLLVQFTKSTIQYNSIDDPQLPPYIEKHERQPLSQPQLRNSTIVGYNHSNVVKRPSDFGHLDRLRGTHRFQHSRLFRTTYSWANEGHTPLFSFRIVASKAIADADKPDSHEVVETSFGLILVPARWLNRLGINLGLRVSAMATHNWTFMFSSFGAVPEDALIFDLCKQGNVAGIKILLDREDVSVDSEDLHGRTPLWTAAYYGQVDAAKFLLDAGAEASYDTLTDVRESTVAIDARVKLALLDVILAKNPNPWRRKYYLSLLIPFYWPNKDIPLPRSERSDHILHVFRALDPYLATDDASRITYLWDMIWHNYDGLVIQSLIRSIRGDIVTYVDSVRKRSVLHEAIRMRFLDRDTISVKMIMEKTTTADFHYAQKGFFEDGVGETPTSLAMRDWKCFITWRRLLQEVGQDTDSFIEREIEAGPLVSQGWTKESLKFLFNREFTLPEYDGSRILSFPGCDRCKFARFDLNVNFDLEFRRELREIRTGRAQARCMAEKLASMGSIDACANTDDPQDTANSSHNRNQVFPPLPYRFVCSGRCREGKFSDVFENDSTDEPDFQPRVIEVVDDVIENGSAKEGVNESTGLEETGMESEEGGNEIDPTSNMPGAFLD